MTNQEAFDKAVRHTLKQGERSVIVRERFPSVGPVERCAYRGEGGRMCPVGALIPDEEYDETMEGRSAVELVNGGVLSLQGLDVNLLASMQRVHDINIPCYWEERFRSIAEEFDLTFPELEDAS